MAADDSLLAQLAAIGGELARRGRNEQRLDRYYEGSVPLPAAITKAKVTRAYKMLIGLSDAPWGQLIVNSVQSRLAVTGVQSGDKTMDDALWEVWQANSMDLEAPLAHNAALVGGRGFAMVWPGDDGQPEISLDNASQMCVQYRPGSRRKRVAAMRAWEENERLMATLYRPDGIYKFQAPEGDRHSVANAEWERRVEDGEEWPVPNPYGVVPVTELAVNRRLKPGMYGYARGEFESCTGLIDRINLLTFIGLVVAFWMGFPLRGVIGEKIRREVLVDDNGDPIIDPVTTEPQTRPVAPFDANAGGIFQLENPQATLAEYKAADRKLLSIYQELDQLAAITATPRHYLPMEQGMTNLSADAIRASEGSLVAKVPGHKASLGEGWEETLRLAGLMLDQPVVLPQTAQLQWADHETRSLAERADAAVKLAGVLPTSAIAELALDASAEQLARWRAERASDTLGQLLTAAAPPAPAGMPPAGMPAAPGPSPNGR